MLSLATVGRLAPPTPTPKLQQGLPVFSLHPVLSTWWKLEPSQLDWPSVEP